jgi:hypothetical protein
MHQPPRKTQAAALGTYAPLRAGVRDRDHRHRDAQARSVVAARGVSASRARKRSQRTSNSRTRSWRAGSGWRIASRSPSTVTARVPWCTSSVMLRPKSGSVSPVAPRRRMGFPAAAHSSSFERIQRSLERRNRSISRHGAARRRRTPPLRWHRCGCRSCGAAAARTGTRRCGRRARRGAAHPARVRRLAEQP